MACLRAPHQATTTTRFPLARIFSPSLPFFVGWCRQAQSSIRVALSTAPIYSPWLCLIAAASRDCFIATTSLFLLHRSGVRVPISSGPIHLPWLCLIAAASRDRLIATASHSLLYCSEPDTVLYRSNHLPRALTSLHPPQATLHRNWTKKDLKSARQAEKD